METEPTCTKCGERIIRDFAGWMHHPRRPMTTQEQRALRHVVRPSVPQPAR